MPGTIRSRKFEADLKKLTSAHGQVVEEVFDGLEWELMNASSFDCYHIIDDENDNEYRAILSIPTQRAPQLMLIFGFEEHSGEHKIVHVGLRVAESESHEAVSSELEQSDSVSSPPESTGR